MNVFVFEFEHTLKESLDFLKTMPLAHPATRREVKTLMTFCVTDGRLYAYFRVARRPLKVVKKLHDLATLFGLNSSDTELTTMCNVVKMVLYQHFGENKKEGKDMSHQV